MRVDGTLVRPSIANRAVIEALCFLRHHERVRHQTSGHSVKVLTTMLESTRGFIVMHTIEWTSDGPLRTGPL